jgi:hypothetical protein
VRFPQLGSRPVCPPLLYSKMPIGLKCASGVGREHSTTSRNGHYRVHPSRPSWRRRSRRHPMAACVPWPVGSLSGILELAGRARQSIHENQSRGDHRRALGCQTGHGGTGSGLWPRPADHPHRAKSRPGRRSRRHGYSIRDAAARAGKSARRKSHQHRISASANWGAIASIAHCWSRCWARFRIGKRHYEKFSMH